MTDDELLAEARSEHFELEERARQHAWVGIVPRRRQRWPCSVEPRQAIYWMRDGLSRECLFVEGPASARFCRVQIGIRCSEAEASSSQRPLRSSPREVASPL